MPEAAPSLEDLTVDQLREAAARMKGSHDLLSTLLRDPSSRTAIQKEMKRLNPNLAIPELDTATAFETQLKTRDEKIAELEKRELMRSINERLSAERAKTQAKYKLTDAQMLEVEKLMQEDKENPITSYDIGARAFKGSQKPAEPTPAVLKSSTFDMPDPKTWAKGIGNPALLNKIALQQAEQAFNEIRTGQVAGS
jgi:hypothetical protein